VPRNAAHRNLFVHCCIENVTLALVKAGAFFEFFAAHRHLVDRGVKVTNQDHVLGSQFLAAILTDQNCREVFRRDLKVLTQIASI